MHRNLVKTSILALTAAAVFVAGSMGGATAARLIGSADILNNSLQQEDLHANSVGNAELRTDAVGWGNVTADAQERIRGLAGQDGIQGERGPRGFKGETGEKGDPGDPASDRFGEYTDGVNIAATSIQKIGGSYSTNATTLDTFTVPEAGKYLISAWGYFDRINEGAAGYEAPTTVTYLQLTVRGGFPGSHAGTCFTPAVSPRGFTETTCQSVQVITANAGDVITVRAFGYNEDRSGFGGTPNSATPQFTAAAAVSAVRIG
jgi:hypothetical protein